ncbi:MAG: thiamine phosphate synthase [Rickettsiales bacterium]|nr:thiamine phosphate synthase [Rickettsiales bacterium]
MYSVYLVTDSALKSTNTLEEAVEQAIKGGCTIVQLREKEIGSLDFYNLGIKIKAITDKYHISLLINDRLDIAQAINADGIHIGQSDIPCVIARNILGKNKIIGVSASNLQEAIQGEKDGADYLGVGAMYAQTTKKDARTTSFEELKKIKKDVKIPIVVIGGINQKTISDFKGYGIDGFAMVSAIIGAKNIEENTRKLKNEIDML